MFTFIVNLRHPIYNYREYRPSRSLFYRKGYNFVHHQQHVSVFWHRQIHSSGVLDHSAAFDHSILLSRLSTSFGVTDTAYTHAFSPTSLAVIIRSHWPAFIYTCSLYRGGSPGISPRARTIHHFPALSTPLDIRNSPSICCFRRQFKTFFYNLAFRHLSPTTSTLAPQIQRGFPRWHCAQYKFTYLRPTYF